MRKLLSLLCLFALVSTFTGLHKPQAWVNYGAVVSEFVNTAQELQSDDCCLDSNVAHADFESLCFGPCAILASMNNIKPDVLHLAETGHRNTAGSGIPPDSLKRPPRVTL